jgi:hypothetical protein
VRLSFCCVVAGVLVMLLNRWIDVDTPIELMTMNTMYSRIWCDHERSVLFDDVSPPFDERRARGKNLRNLKWLN